MLSLSSLPRDMLRAIAKPLDIPSVAAMTRACRATCAALDVEAAAEEKMRAQGAAALPRGCSTWRALWCRGVQHRRARGAGNYVIEMSKTRDAGGDHEALLVAKGRVAVGAEPTFTITGSWTEKETDADGNSFVDENEQWLVYDERLTGSLCLMEEKWHFSLQSHYEGPRWEYYWDDFDLQIDKKHAIDGYQLRFTGSYRGHGSAYEFAHGEDVVVVLTWCPPAERRSKRVRQ